MAQPPNLFDASVWKALAENDDARPEGALACAHCGEPIHTFDRYFDFEDGAGPVCADCRVDYTDKFEHTA